MFKPEKGEEYEFIYITQDEGAMISSAWCLGHDLQGPEKDENYQAQNCFPLGTLTKQDLAKVEDCIRGLHDKKTTC